jgi:hypothetical protein
MGSSTCMGSVADSPSGLGSDFVLSFFFFFLGISAAVSHVSLNVPPRSARLITHLGYLLPAAQQFPQYPWPSSSSSSFP